MDIATLEKAAETLLAPPNLVQPEERRNAEQFLQDFKKNITIEDIGKILQMTVNPFVLFQMAQAVGELLLRDWALLDEQTVVSTYQSLLEFVATQQTIRENFVISEFLKSAAMIIKRGILDGKSGDQEQLYQFINSLLTNESAHLQSIGCSFISALIEQFSSSWRNNKFSITWDFHLKAKSKFENSGLRRLLEMSLTTLHALSNQEDVIGNEFSSRLCEKFLEVAENIFTWNFSARIFRRYMATQQASNSFRPPESWKDLMSNQEFYTLFFKLHAKIRTVESLSIRSMNCLIQLASLTGDCMPVQDVETSTSFVSLYIENLLALFAEGPLKYETHLFCSVIHRLFTYRPLGSIIRLQSELRAKFFFFLRDYCVHLTEVAMRTAIGCSDHDDHASLALIYESYAVVLRGNWYSANGGPSSEEVAVIDRELLKEPAMCIVNQFLSSVLAPPIGTRPVPNDEADVDDNDDRVLFNDLLTPVSYLMCYNVQEFMNELTKHFRRSFADFLQLASGSVNVNAMPSWQEDQHWLLLVLASSVIGEEMDLTCHVRSEVFDLTCSLATNGYKFSPERKFEFLHKCMTAPTEDRTAYDGIVDPFITLIGELFSWSEIEHEMTSSSAKHLVSPELTRSTLLALRRVINAASNPFETEILNGAQLPLLVDNDEFSLALVQFTVKKVFTILAEFPGEEKLCNDAVECLAALIESRATVIASSDELFQYLCLIDIAKLPNRKNLMKALVQIGTATEDSDAQEKMFTQILLPLIEKFKSAVMLPSADDVDSSIVDYLQCFDGVASASQSQSAKTIFKFIQPVIMQCARLMRSRSHVPSMVTQILQLILDVTTKVSVYIDDQEESNLLYATLVQIVHCYRSDQVKRFVGVDLENDDVCTDLCLFLEILSNVVSKDFMADEKVSTGARVAIESLQVLLTIMNETVLEMPEVALKFFRLILFLVEFAPDSISEMTPDLTISLCECIKLGFSGRFGNEVMSVCLEALTEIVLHFNAEVNRPKISQQLLEQIHICTPMVFESCLENSCETSIFSDACGCLFSMINFDRQFFETFVSELLSRKSNERTAGVLREAFQDIMLTTDKPTRRERIHFRTKMEGFLNKIQGLLSYN